MKGFKERGVNFGGHFVAHILSPVNFRTGKHFESREFSHGILSVFRGGVSHGFLARRAGRNVGTLSFFVRRTDARRA